MKRATVGHVAMFAANIVWGLMAPVSKTVLLHGSVNYLALTAFRAGGAALAFWAASLFFKKEKVSFRDLGLLFLASLFAIVFNQGIFVMGISMTSASNASIITTTSPIIAMVLAALYLKEPITWKKVLGIVVGASGALMLILSSAHVAGGGEQASIKGDLLCLLAQFSYSIYFVFFKWMTNKYSPVTLMKWIFFFAALIYVPLAWNSMALIDYGMIPASIWGDIAFIVFGGTFLAYLMIPIGQKRLRPTVAIMYNYLQPIVAVMVAVAWGLDSFGPEKAVAVLLVFGGVYLVTQSRARNPEESA